MTGATATMLCGCEVGSGSNDMRVLPRPVVFDMRHDIMELYPIYDDGGWPADGSDTSYTAVVALANASKARMEAAVHPKPTAAGAGQCTEGLPEPKLQPCCTNCHQPLLPMRPCRGSVSTVDGVSGECTCSLEAPAEPALAPPRTDGKR